MFTILSPVAGGGISMAPIVQHITEGLEQAQRAIDEAVTPKKATRAPRTRKAAA